MADLILDDHGLEVIRKSGFKNANGDVNIRASSPLLNGNPPAASTATNTNSVLVAANTSRLGLIITNTQNTDVFLAFGQTAIVDTGIFLRRDGFITLNSTFNTTEALNGITSAGSALLIYQEFE